MPSEEDLKNRANQIDMIESIHRIFFHELGHYVAKELNLLFYEGTGTAEILIYPCQNNQSYYCGHIKPVIPTGVDPLRPLPFHKVKQQIASKIYGCIFQSYYSGAKSIKGCLYKYGEDDSKTWIECLSFHGLSSYSYELVQAEEEHFQKLKNDNVLDSFIQLDPEEYIIPTYYESYKIDLEKLKNDTNILIRKHYKYYQELIDKYKTILETTPKA